jgi:hypothetical protein
MAERPVRMLPKGRLVSLSLSGAMLLVVLAGCGQPATRDQAAGPTNSSQRRELPPEEGPALVQPPSPPEGDPEEQPPNSAPGIGSEPRDVLNEPTGLLCRDLKAKGYPYSAAVDYWRAARKPNRMDVDRNGIPCETVYPAAEVQQYWTR